ncbi:MAG TPA: hypothetical protein VFO55_11300 [Gemmatimonadaceae bacterium]|nr:hypothetical protein [Gemmatimonadaceae bacterium]
MYTTCLFCHSDLGSNEAIESFPVGRRLAFDAVRGRLWVVCRKCERWNLTPMEERWEAVEQCERLFTSTRLRVSTDNIGMSRLSEGLELVRIGQPQRPEMAAWRYGDQFGRRRMKHIGYTVGAGVVVAGAIIAGPMLGVSVASGGWGMFQGVNALMKAARDRVVRTRVAIPGYEKPSVIRGKDLKRIVLGVDHDGLLLRLPFNHGQVASVRLPNEVTLRGDEAMRAAGTILPALNIKGGSRQDVQAAVKHLESLPDPLQLFATSTSHGRIAQRALQGKKKSRRAQLTESETFIDRIPSTMLLALEMAAHEDVERRAMEGELAILEAAWRQAEEIAAIADNLLVPASVDVEFDTMKERPR